MYRAASPGPEHCIGCQPITDDVGAVCKTNPHFHWLGRLQPVKQLAPGDEQGSQAQPEIGQSEVQSVEDENGPGQSQGNDSQARACVTECPRDPALAPKISA